jgi:cyclopropane fatty-acyl-phospholipid synthase-like methyltransferase
MTTHFSVPSDWYLNFFTGPVMRFWEAAVPPAATEADTAFIVRHLALKPPARILDVACGAGRHALGLAKSGFHITGFDRSEAALKRAVALADAEALPAHFFCADMREFEVDAPADALICMGNSLGYFEPAMTMQLLHRFARSLRQGGRLILDTSICAESLLPLASERSFSFPGGTYEQEIAYDAEQSLIRTRAHLTLDGERHELLYRHFVMTSGELVRMLRASGFGICGLYGDTADAPFGPGSQRLLLVAELRIPS